MKLVVITPRVYKAVTKQNGRYLKYSNIWKIFVLLTLFSLLHHSIWVIEINWNITNYSPQVSLLPFYHHEENQLSIRINSFSLKYWARSFATKAQSFSVHQSFTQTLNLVAVMFSSLVISKAFSWISALVISISSFHFSVTHFSVKLIKAAHFRCWKDFAWLLAFLRLSFSSPSLDSCLMSLAIWSPWSWLI